MEKTLKGIIKSLVILIVLISSTYGQEENHVNFRPKIGLGAALPGITTWILTYDNRYTNIPLTDLHNPVYPKLFYSFGLETVGMIKIYNCNIDLAIDFSHGESSTGKVSSALGKGEFKVSSTPIMLWISIKPIGDIRPYLSLGLGYEKSEWVEKYYGNNVSAYNAQLEQGNFAYGGAAGLEFDINKKVALAIFINSIVKERNKSKTLEDGRQFLFDARNGLYFTGITIGYKI